MKRFVNSPSPLCFEMASSLMVSQAHHLVHSSIILPPISKLRIRVFHSFPPSSSLGHCNHLNLRPIPFSITKHSNRIVASASSSSPAQSFEVPMQDSLTGSTKTLATIVALALSLLGVFMKLIQKFAVPIKAICATPIHEQLAAISNLQSNLVCTTGPLFFAAMRDRPSGYLNTPLTVVAAGLSKWLDIYSGVLMVRVLLSWFPNIPWDRQPLSAIRDLCDPYLNLFRNIIPPIFDTLDVSPLLAFAVLGTLGSILNSSRGMY
ncbi:ylmG-like protein 1-2, chloroplastic-like [Quillaja saponaria]|uniref:YlmG-like protein 1-2, chloroplastic-like n=1 Tax=Quillaja saponaria TaxID=32244 RepID=A0AAD7Q2W5_QUISA|nr:ylmG-like protein 1-2, chloroplastic-like [Quillaja saponaria]